MNLISRSELSGTCEYRHKGRGFLSNTIHPPPPLTPSVVTQQAGTQPYVGGIWGALLEMGPRLPGYKESGDNQ